MRDLRVYLDATFLKTVADCGGDKRLLEQETMRLVDEAILERYKLVMIRPEYVAAAKSQIDASGSTVLVGTVIDFPLGIGGVERKLEEAALAVADGADELDFVVDYEAFKRGKMDVVKSEVRACTAYALAEGKVVKWIIEVAALSSNEVVRLTALIKNVVLAYFPERSYSRVFIKSSTGFYVTQDGTPNGATLPNLVLMLENAGPLPVKASGGIRNRADAIAMLDLGVQRLGTSAAKVIVSGSNENSTSDY